MIKLFMATGVVCMLASAAWAQNIERSAGQIFNPARELQAMQMVPVCAPGSLVAVSGTRLVCAGGGSNPAVLQGVRSKSYSPISFSRWRSGTGSNGNDTYAQAWALPGNPDYTNYQITGTASNPSLLRLTLNNWGHCQSSHPACTLQRVGNNWNAVCVPNQLLQGINVMAWTGSVSAVIDCNTLQ